MSSPSGSLSSSSSTSSSPPWIPWFTSLPGNALYASIPPAYIMDAFNLYGLRAITPNFTATLNTLLDRSTLSTPLPDTIRLYGLIHSRYILTTPGLSQMSEKYLNGDFGYCPLIKCGGEKNRQKCLPIGISDVPGVSSIKLYCPRCQNTFEKNTQSLESDTEIDGAHFGSSFLGSFFLGNPELVVEGECKEVPDVMRVFGFKVHGSSVALQSVRLDILCVARSE